MPLLYYFTLPPKKNHLPPREQVVLLMPHLNRGDGSDVSFFLSFAPYGTSADNLLDHVS